VLLSPWRVDRVPVLFAPALACALAVPRSADAQGVFRATPSVSVTQQHDSNVFSTQVDPEADFVTRVSSGVETEYRSPLWTMSGRYVLDNERFAEHAGLDSMDARQRAAVAFGYRPTARVAWAVDGEFWKTRTPGELNAATGLTFTRAAARRLSAHSSVTRHLTPVSTGTIDYGVTQDHLAGGTGATTHDAAVGIQRRRSLRETVTLDYRFRDYVFVAAGTAPASAAISHAVTLGWTRAITPGLRISLDGGPRVTNSVAAAELFASVQYQRLPGDVSLTYARTQATVIGFAGVADTQSLSATAARTVWSSIRMRVGPSVFRSALGGARADAYVFTLDLTRPITPSVAIEVAVDGSLQRGSLYGRLANTTIARHGALIRLVAGPPTKLR
jgi:hypothetical protein